MHEYGCPAFGCQGPHEWCFLEKRKKPRQRFLSTSVPSYEDFLVFYCKFCRKVVLDKA